MKDIVCGYCFHVPEAERDRFMRIADVVRMTGMGKSTLYLKIANGRFPPQIRVPGVGAVWRESLIVAWMDNPT